MAKYVIKNAKKLYVLMHKTLDEAKAVGLYPNDWLRKFN